jgi:hypothetical protein
MSTIWVFVVNLLRLRPPFNAFFSIICFSLFGLIKSLTNPHLGMTRDILFATEIDVVVAVVYWPLVVT